ncbi:MAG: hypothetical protein IKG47_00220 [Oscillospiraceae bacterium]|nr:hypothetical protein [Clostridiales bacterium]MBR3353769.1 hypothetical protein [Oscillospiraceae bacterium]
MVGRTNALLHSMVSSVNGKTGIVEIGAGDLPYNIGTEYSDGTVGDAITELTNKVEAAGDGFNYKGSVPTYSELPSSAEIGDEYTVTDEDNAKYAWDGSNWINLNESVITTAQINALFE